VLPPSAIRFRGPWRIEALQAGETHRLPTAGTGSLPKRPFKGKGIGGLGQQTTGAGTTFLRWRNRDRSTRSMALWEALLADTTMPALLIDGAYHQT
jgi:hypothetical protein